MRFLLLLLFPFLSIAQKAPALLVNPFIGTGGHGHTFPGATVPFGMVQLSPDTRIDGSWDGCGGYHYSDSIIYGFSHTHLSGTGVSDYGDIMLMPMPLQKASTKPKNYASPFSHANEKAGAGWYEVFLDKHQIKVELTASQRVGFHKYTFPQKSGALVIDLEHRDQLTKGYIEKVDHKHIRGYRISSAWAKEQHVYFDIEFSEPFTSIANHDSLAQWTRNTLIKFENLPTNILEVKVGLSFTSMEGAEKNRKTEAYNKNFTLAKKQTIENWNRELNVIQIKGGTADQQTIFYSALYHTMLQPNMVNDVDGQYRGMDKKKHHSEHPVYSVFSLWDTFRAAHPLYAILFPQRQADFIKTFLLMYQQGGRLPVWELAANETDCMIGYHSVSVIADSWAKGIHDFDSTLALEAMLKSANWNHLGIPAYKTYGHLMIDDEHESVSKTLEYAYDDWCIASFAEAINKKEISENYYLRSQSWKNLLYNESDNNRGFMRPKKNGTWQEPFDPREVNNNFTEANSWQYSFFVPHDLKGLTEMYGNKNELIAKLDQLFTTDSRTTGREQVDITGLIGQYAHGNEPSHHMAWMFTELGQPATSQKYVLQILKDLYKNAPDGLSGNEDCGQMSAWYVFSAMGFYPFCPGKPKYTLGNPLFDEVKITPYRGKTFTINTSGKGNWVNKVNEGTQYTFHHNDITIGKTINLVRSEISPKPFEPIFAALPVKSILPVPVFNKNPMVFRDSLLISISPPEKGCTLYYTTNNSTPSLDSPIFPQNLKIINSCKIQVIAQNKSGQLSLPARAYFHKNINNWDIQIHSKYNSQYTAGGDSGIIDGLYGDLDWRKGGWQGYQGQDFECEIDLKEVRMVNGISTSFLQDTRSWIVFPKEVTIEYSKDKVNYILYETVENTIPADDYTIQARPFNAEKVIMHNQLTEPLPQIIETPMRYIRIKAKNFGTLPNWHQGAGGEAFIFIDEISVN